jgi:hypothetical protein
MSKKFGEGFTMRDKRDKGNDMKKLLILLAMVGLLFSGCAASTAFKKYEWVPMSVNTGNTQAQDEAECRMRFHEYRTGINSNWASGQVYYDCMEAKGYVKKEPSK